MIISDNAKAVLEKRYLIRDDKGTLCEDIPGMFDRVAGAIAKADENYGGDVEAAKHRFFEMMTSFEFLPNSPTLMNAGRPLGQLSACFVLPVEDSMEAIFESIKQAALIHKSGGGTGFSFSRLRQKGASVHSTGGVASGPVSFMRVFNMATEAVKQGGTRRGANMGILRIDHPDILEFIDCKRNNADITNFNISVGITEKFMQSVLKGEEYDLIDPSTKKVTGRLNAAYVFEKIVDAAWQNGEPGIIFLDRLNRDNAVPSQGEIESTNPCGEQPLLPYESCNLGSINLYKMLKKTDKGYEIDYDKLKCIVTDAVHFLDNVIDVNKYPLDHIAKKTLTTRKIGLGIMGFADMLLRLGIPYNSEKGIKLAEKIMSFINTAAKEASAELAKRRGAFPLFDESIYTGGKPLRNATCTTIAPTGTLSIIANCSSGIEPIFAFAYTRTIMDGAKFCEVNPVLREILSERGLLDDKLMDRIAETGHVADIKELPEDIRKVFVSSHEISPDYHIRMQAAFQRHTDNAVSKTVNFTHDATHDDVREVYLTAYNSGCKGVTIYRDGSRDMQVLSVPSKPAKEKEETSKENCESCETCTYKIQSDKITPRVRPDITTGFTEKVITGCGNLYITVNYDDKGICEVFTNTGRAGGCPSQSEATARLVSMSLRSGIDAQSVITQLKGIRCPSTIRQPGMKVTSCPDAIARVIEKVSKLQNGSSDLAEKAGIPHSAEKLKSDDDGALRTGVKFCSECGSKLEHEGGCVICRNCGYSKCG